MKNVEKVICSAFTIEVCNKLVEPCLRFLCVCFQIHTFIHTAYKGMWLLTMAT